MLAISEEFTSIQGEGSLAGFKTYFVRLQGCSVGCHFCDTKYTWKKGDQTTDEYSIIVRALASHCKWVCITGGEPLEQDISLLVRNLRGIGMNVMIETSGTAELKDDLDAHIILSPKDLFTKKEVLPIYYQRANELKCIVTKEDDIKYHVEKHKTFRGKNKFFQPVNNDPAIARMIMEKMPSDWRLSLQMHKVIEVQ